MKIKEKNLSGYENHRKIHDKKIPGQETLSGGFGVEMGCLVFSSP